ncbi:ABC transporter substrate-binding protein [Idiomarina sp. OT37-5b]|jgi:putative thiamine transport system substrate-binding protein|uniref:ABC transporter substrate-binding protein n=1 Tax=Idiomarina sp. OT37-5b TaxID=2100422 RepID=UPI000CFA1906|nr:ABC transporter substrate-binding protein [Idiomarina sp. OT37-5b]AVJ55327.1 ABC transporter substrate-binding protein [Idiomarina sp. OT37-5b]
MRGWLLCLIVIASLLPAVSLAQTQTVYFYAWGGNPAVNDYLRWAASELRRQDIELRHVKVADIAEVVKQLTDGRSNADLLWINGENFHALKAAGKLYPVADKVSNLSQVSNELNWRTDFGEPVDGLEVPWGLGQFYLLSCNECLIGDAVSAEQLLLYAEQHPGTISYPKPPEFHGTTFLKALLLSLSENHEPFQQPVTEVDADALTRPLWNYLERLHPLLWQQGENFPASAAEMQNWFANGVLHIAVSFNPNDVQTLVNQGRIPAQTQRVILGEAAITNHHYLAVPTTAKAKPAATQVINFLLSEKAQRRKAQLDGWGDPAVIRLSADDETERLPVAADFHASWQAYLEQAWSERFQ